MPLWDKGARTRRQFIVDATLTVSTIAEAGRSRRLRAPEYGRLAARPARAPTNPLAPGEHVLSTSSGRDTVVFIPSTLAAGHLAPVMVALHGATGDSSESLQANRDAAEAAGVILIAPSSNGVTWDAIRGLYGDDLERVDRALAHVFQHCAVDPRRIAISGFSDGATYAISVGLVNGDLFTHIIAHSAGFIIPGRPHGRPKIFIAHGAKDQILPIDRCGRRIATELQGDGYDVRFVEFDGGHAVQPEIVRQAIRWFAG